jgi:hypothetical protein
MLAGLFALCLVSRIVMAWRTPGICPDAVLYMGLGKAYEAGQFQDALGQIRFNIYPIILSLIHRLGLPWETAGVAWGAGIASCTVLPLFGWVRRAYGSQVAVAGCALYAIHPGLIRWSVEIIRDQTFWFLLALGLYLLWRAVTEIRWWWHVSAGAAITLACLTRFEGLVLFIPLLGWTWWGGGGGGGEAAGGEGGRGGGEGRDKRKPTRSVPDTTRYRLVVWGLVCASFYPLSLFSINAFWFHGRTADLIRNKPVELAQDWAQESITGHRSLENRDRSDLPPPLPQWKMAERFTTGMFKGFTPLYLLAVIVGIASGISASGFREILRHGNRSLTCASGLVMAAIWIHLYWSHEAGPRYFFPIVIMAAPLAGQGLLRISATVAQRMNRAQSPLRSLLVQAAPLAAILVVNVSLAWGGDNRGREATIVLGHWVHEHYGTARLLGPDGVTQVVTHYAHGRCQSFPENAQPADVWNLMEILRPNVVLLAADRHGSPGDTLSAGLAARGFEAMEASNLPDGGQQWKVFVDFGRQVLPSPSCHLDDDLQYFLPGPQYPLAPPTGDKPRS